MALLPDGRPLVGGHVRLDPVAEGDLPDLAAILTEPALYGSGYIMERRPASPAEALAKARGRYLDAPAPDGLGQGRISYTIRLVADSPLGPAGRVVGTSSIAEAFLVHERIHLGGTMYHPQVWGTMVNPAAKYLLLRHCFEDLGYGRVKLQTDAVNLRSAGAIVRLGATREGVLRRHTRREDGSFRDTVVFSVTRDDWPGVRDGLLDRLATA